MNIAVLNQQDPRWSNTELGTGQGVTIGRYGCALTDQTMLANYAGRSVTPDKLNNLLIAVDGFAPNGAGSNTLLRWGAITQVYGEIQLQQNVTYPSTPADMGMIDTFLNNQQPVIVGVAFDHNPNTQVPSHYVLLTGKNVDGTYQCNDPWFGDSANFNNRYAVNGMTPGNAILQVVAYSVPVPPPAPQAPEAAHPQAAVVPEDVNKTQADQNYNLYMQEVATNKQLNDRITELQAQVTELQSDNQKQADEVANTKTLNATLADKLKQYEASDSATIENLQKQVEKLKEKEQIANTTAEKLQVKPKLTDVLSALDNLFSIKDWASKLTGKTTKPASPVLQALGILDEEVSS